MKRFVALFFLVLAPLVAQGAVREIKMTYALYYGKAKVGDVTERFVVQNNQYRIESVAKPILSWILPTLTATSSGTITADGLRPEHFTQSLSKQPEKNLAADFNWETSELTLNVKGEIKKEELKPGTQDSLSLKYQFMFAPPQSGGNVLLTDGKKIEEYAYRIMKEGKIATPSGQHDTVHIAKVAKEGDATFELWLDKEQHFLPVRVLAANNDQRVEQLLTKISIDEVAQK
jgi:Protein of unknown function (DUF3108)